MEDYGRYNDKIINATLKVYQDCQIQSFPIHCKSIITHYGYECIPYSSLSRNKREICMKLSEDALLLDRCIYYNDHIHNNRMKFSLMHELGHIILHHDPRQNDCEAEANRFASHILAPRMAIHYARCKNTNDVADIFGITPKAAYYAFLDYAKWHRYITYFKMNSTNKKMYQHFYSAEFGVFVWRMNSCMICGQPCINENVYCTSCRDSLDHHGAIYVGFDPYSPDFDCEIPF